nr:hypothetical protein [Tanacetum cinerariifolium]
CEVSLLNDVIAFDGVFCFCVVVMIVASGILEGWQRARIAGLSNLHSRTHNRSPPVSMVNRARFHQSLCCCRLWTSFVLCENWKDGRDWHRLMSVAAIVCDLARQYLGDAEIICIVTGQAQ